MCLGVPGKVVTVSDAASCRGVVEVAGVRREVNLHCVLAEGEPPERCIGEWVLVHVGFAMSRIDEHQARLTLQLLEELGEELP